MRTSLVQVLKELESFTSRHLQLKTFEAKPITEFTAKNYVYPVAYVNLEEMNTSFEAGQTIMDLHLYIVDRVERDFSNIVEVMSSTLLMCDDFYNYYTEDPECTLGFHFNVSSNASPIAFPMGEDLVCGHTITLKCAILNDRNRNVVPLSN